MIAVLANCLRAALLGTAVGCLAGGPVISAAYARSCERATHEKQRRNSTANSPTGAQRCSAPAGQSEKPKSGKNESAFRCLISPSFAKPADGNTSTVQFLAVVAGSPVLPHPVSCGLIADRPARAAHVSIIKPFDALAPPLA